MNGATEANGQNTPLPPGGEEQSSAWQAWKQTWTRTWEPFSSVLKCLSSLNFATLLGSLYVIAILISIFFDLLYLGVLGISPVVAPLSLADYLRSSIIWIPPVLIVAITTPVFSAIWSFSYAVLERDLKNTCKMTSTLLLVALPILMLAFICVFSRAMWWSIWNVATPYDFSFFKGELKWLGALLTQLNIWILIIFMMIFLYFPISRHRASRGNNTNKIIKLKRIESRVLNISSFAILISCFIHPVPIFAKFSKLGVDCSQFMKSSLVANDKGTVLRSFENYFLVVECADKNADAENSIKFLRIDKHDLSVINDDSVSAREQNETEQNAPKQPERSGADLNSANSPTQPAASQPPRPSAGQP